MDARSRIAQRIGDRVQRQTPRSILPGRPALAGPGGTVQALGGNPIPGRATQSSGAIPVGGTAQRNQGVIQGAPEGRGPEWSQPVPDLSPLLLAAGVPTIETARPRYPTDFAIDSETEQLYRWDEDEGPDGDWVPIGGSELPTIFEPNDPEDPGVAAGQRFVNTVDETLFIWDGVAWFGPIGGGVSIRTGAYDPNSMDEPTDVPFFYDSKALRLFTSSFTGALDWYPTGSKSWNLGSGPQPDRAYPGDSAINSDGQMFVMRTTGSWLMLCTSCEETPDTTPPPFSFPGSTWG